MDQLQKRLLSSAVLITITLLTIFLSPGWFFFLIVEGFVLLGTFEFLNLAEKKGVKVYRIPTFIFAAFIPVSVYSDATGFVLMLACLVFFILHFQPRSLENSLVSVAAMIFGLVYIAWFFSYLIPLREVEQGSAWIFYTILLTKGGDAGAYFTGKKFGKMKLIEHISPNKSVEGAIGGFVVTVLLSLISMLYLRDAGFLHLLWLGILVGIFAQFGDLGESLLKRDVGVKDSGTVPGLGGVLDVLDSLLLTIPLVFFYITKCIYV